jgi:predicted dehydrogenase
MTNHYKVALIGCGLRGVWYLYNIKEARLPISIVALADTDKKYCDIANKLFANNNATLFNSGEDLITNSSLDGVIIASPNDAHCGSMVSASKEHLKILLEKPVATAVDHFRQMWRAQNAHKARIVIGFCLRYTPFYSKINEVVKNGEIGQVLAINAEELMSDDLSMVFNRGDWRPDGNRSGGLLLEKCSHDMDIINWIADSKAEHVFSDAKRTFLKPRKDTGPVCSKCAIKDTCRFTNANVIAPFEAEWPKELHEMLGKLSDETCAYRNHRYPDHQTVNITFENGILCNFTVAQAQPATRRTIHIIGSKGRIYGVLNDNRFTIFKQDLRHNETLTVIEVHPDASGHSGGDSVLTSDFLKLLEGNPNKNRPGLQEGIEAAMMCLAADQSVESHEFVKINPMRRKVFGDEITTVIKNAIHATVKC